MKILFFKRSIIHILSQNVFVAIVTWNKDSLALAENPPGLVVLDGIRDLCRLLQVGRVHVGQLQLVVDRQAATGGLKYGQFPIF